MDVPPDGAAPAETGLRLGVVPGVSPGRWVDTWRGRHRDVPLDLVQLDAAGAEEALLGGDVDAAFLRLPLRSSALVRIPLWTEETVVALSRENELTLLDSLTPADLAGETLIVPADDVLAWANAPGERFTGLQPATTADALDLVAHEAGVCVLPKAIARELHRRDVELRPLVAEVAADDDDDGETPAVPASQIALAWLPLETGEPAALVEQLIGIVRGRTSHSTRGGASAPSGTGAGSGSGSGSGSGAGSGSGSGGTPRPRRSERRTPPRRNPQRRGRR